MNSLSPPQSILRYFNSWIEEGHLYIQTEFCDGGNLSGLQNSSLNETNLWQIAFQISQALAFLHSINLVHLDVKPENILCNKSRSRFVLADFGLTTPLYGSQSPQEKDALGQIGDRRFLSCELMDGRLDALDKSDVLALGLTLFAVVCCC